ncbi:MAG: hypothetical protein U0905_13655 [Pirellulales bacterium]
MSLSDFIAAQDLQELGGKLRDAVNNAARFYDAHSEDEDALTGAFAQEIIRELQGVKLPSGDEVSVRHRKYRGRGQNADEIRLGADGFFEVEVKEGNTVKTTKSLPYQAKNDWKKTDKDLVKQCKKMHDSFGEGASIVVNYTKNGYEGYKTEDVIESGGKESESGSTSLGDMLGSQFLNCKIGKEGLNTTGYKLNSTIITIQKL